jgi:hypothetical protein
MPRNAVAGLVGEYEVMLCHVALLQYKFKQSVLQNTV